MSVTTIKCTRPMTAYRSNKGRNPNGSWPIVFNMSEGYKDMKVDIPCGKCIGCRLEKSRQWAIRCVNEAQCWKHNCFVTLTYNKENIPEDKSINKKVVQKFIKRLRKKLNKKNIRYFLCGEYGDKFERPHYHLCLFNIEFKDKYLHSNKENVKLYRSKILEDVWKKGYSTIGELTFESAAYVARYITKKITGPMAEEHYNGREPEFCLMSRKPGLGKYWYDMYKSDVENTDRVIIRNNLQITPPIYYDNISKMKDPEGLKVRKEERRRKRNKTDYDENYRLDKVNEVVFKKNQKRRYENVRDICN